MHLNIDSIGQSGGTVSPDTLPPDLQKPKLRQQLPLHPQAYSLGVLFCGGKAFSFSPVNFVEEAW
jgi:hypothetical protein